MLNEIQTVKRDKAEPSSADVASDEIDVVIKRLRSGEAHLTAVAYPWGVELDLCEPTVSSRTDNQSAKWP